MWTSQHAVVAAARAAARAAECGRRLAELREHRPVGPDDVARAHASLVAAQWSANAAQGRLLLRRARTGGAPPAGDVQQLPLVTGSPSTGSLDALRRRVHAIGVQDVFVAAFGIGGTTSLFDFEAFAHGLAGLPDIELQAIEQAVWELEQF